MYTPGKLIYFNPFFFKNSSGSKPKYFVVLKVVNDEVLLASLPSSKIHLPQTQQVVHGCLEIPESCINCYVFKATNPICKDGWYFPLDTFLYGEWLDDYTIEQLEAAYSIEHVDYEIIGELTEEELAAVIRCFVNSSRVKRKYKRMLQQY